MNGEPSTTAATDPHPLARIRRSLQAALPWALPLACLVGSWMALRRGFFSRVDIPLWDESVYLDAGWRLLHHADTTTSLPGCFLYTVWYAVWHVLVSDPSALLYAQWLVVDLSLSIALYFVMRAAGARGLLAYLVATYWSALVFAADPPRVGFFALLLVLLAVLGEYRGRLARTGALLAAAAMTRPEYVLVLVSWLAIRGWPRLTRRARRIAIVGIPAGLLLLATLVGTGIGGNRLWHAFGQHYSVRWSARNPSVPVEPWADWETATSASFPGAHSLGQALISNPAEVVRHVAENLREYPGLLVTLVASPALPGRVLGPALIIGILLAIGLRRRWPHPVDFRPPALLALACVSSLPSLLVKPKAVYALPLVLLALFGVARAARSLAASPERARPWLAGTVCALLTVALWLVPPAPAASLPNATAVAQLRSVWAQQGADERWRMLEADGGWCPFVDHERCTSLWLLDKPAHTGFAQYVRESNVNAVLVSSKFRDNAGVRFDPDFSRFLAAPASFGFRPIFSTPKHTFFLKLPEPRHRE